MSNYTYFTLKVQWDAVGETGECFNEMEEPGERYTRNRYGASKMVQPLMPSIAAYKYSTLTLSWRCIPLGHLYIHPKQMIRKP